MRLQPQITALAYRTLLVASLMLTLGASFFEAAPHLLPYAPLKSMEPLQASIGSVDGNSYMIIDLRRMRLPGNIKPFWIRSPAMEVLVDGAPLQGVNKINQMGKETFYYSPGFIVLPPGSRGTLAINVPREYPLRHLLWGLSFLCVLGTLVLRFRGAAPPAGGLTTAGAVTVLALAICIQAAPWFKELIVCADSQSYIENAAVRPFAYPLFIDLVSEADCYEPQSLPLNISLHPDQECGLELLSVVHAQYAVCILAIVVLGAALLSFLSPAATVFSLCFMNAANLILVQPWMNTILSEPLALCFTLLFAAALLFFARSHRMVWLVAAGTAAAFLYWTRPAGIYLMATWMLFLAGAAIRDRRAWKRYAACLVLLPLLAVPGLMRKDSGNPSEGIAYLFSYAMEVSGPELAEFMPDDTTRTYYLRAQERKNELLRQRGIADQPADYLRLIPNDTLDMYFYETLYAVSGTMQREGLVPDDYAEHNFSRLLRTTYLTLLRHNFSAIASLHLATMRVGMGFGDQWNITRLNSGWLRLWVWLPAAVVGLFFIRGWLALLAATFLCSHYLHLVIMCLFNLPRKRYVSASEWLVLLGVLLVFAGLWERFAGRRGMEKASSHQGAFQTT